MTFEYWQHSALTSLYHFFSLSDFFMPTGCPKQITYLMKLEKDVCLLKRPREWGMKSMLCVFEWWYSLRECAWGRGYLHLPSNTFHFPFTLLYWHPYIDNILLPKYWGRTGQGKGMKKLASVNWQEKHAAEHKNHKQNEEKKSGATIKEKPKSYFCELSMKSSVREGITDLFRVLCGVTEVGD